MTISSTQSHMSWFCLLVGLLIGVNIVPTIWHGKFDLVSRCDLLDNRVEQLYNVIETPPKSDEQLRTLKDILTELKSIREINGCQENQEESGKMQSVFRWFGWTWKRKLSALLGQRNESIVSKHGRLIYNPGSTNGKSPLVLIVPVVDRR